jgi:lipopolysaccharide export LptBFGC system permease protein LptF
MIRVQRLVLGELVVTLTLTLLVVTSVLFAGLALQTMSRLAGMDIAFLLRLLPSLLPLAVTFSLPFAFLLTVAFVYGRMVSDRELVALRIAGVHPRVAAMPALALGAVLSAGSLLFSGWVLPEGAREANLRAADVAEQFLSQVASDRRVVTTSKCRLSYARFEPASKGLGTFYDFEIDMRGEGDETLKLIGPELRITRKDGFEDDDDVVIESPWAYWLSTRGTSSPSISARPEPALEAGRVEDLGATTGLNSLLGVNRLELKSNAMTLPDLCYLVRRGNTDKVPSRRSTTELHGRLSTSVLPFLFALVSTGICFQLSPRVRRLTGFLIAFLPVLVVHLLLWLAGRSLSDAGRIPAEIGMWVPGAVLAVTGTVLFGKAFRR